MSYLDHIAYALADAFRCCQGDYRIATLEALANQLLRTAGPRQPVTHSPVWLNRLCIALARQPGLLDQPEQLRQFIRSFPELIDAHRAAAIKPPLGQYFLPEEPLFSPAKCLTKAIPLIQNHQDLLTFLKLTEQQLHWLSKPWSASHSNETQAVHHYFYRWQSKIGTAQLRLIEIPKQKLKAVQRRINQHILASVPVHDNAHGFRKQHSIHSCAQVHQNKRWLLKLDLQNFFVSIPYARIYDLFKFLGYPHYVARQLGLLTTNSIPSKILLSSQLSWRERQDYQIPHLPQGAPSSPTLSNLCAFKLDCRLSALAEKIPADYSRYADDLFFSGNDYQDFTRLLPLIGSIVAEEGFHLNYRKTRVIGSSQQQRVTGIVVNQGANVVRKDYQQLRAILHNCIQYGVSSQQGSQQNFYAHLQGRISFVNRLKPAKGNKLQQLFKQIDWSKE